MVSLRWCLCDGFDGHGSDAAVVAALDVASGSAGVASGVGSHAFGDAVASGGGSSVSFVGVPAGGWCVQSGRVATKLCCSRGSSGL